MFGYVTANFDELNDAGKARYSAVYCGICREIKLRYSQISSMVLSYDTAFLALLLMSLYEPEEEKGQCRCLSHPFKKHLWLSNPYIRYAADMNVALAYHQCMDDWNDDRNLPKKTMAAVLKPYYDRIAKAYLRQCAAMEDCLKELSGIEAAGEKSPDAGATCFGRLMAELFVFTEDLWSIYLRDMGLALGRFIYLADAMVDFGKDRKQGKYNPFLAAGMEKLPENIRDILVLAMGRCADNFEKLPLVQDKELLDNIVYSGVWVRTRISQE